MLSQANDDENSRRKAIQNERAKLSAAYMNGMAITVVAIGGFTAIFQGDFAHMDASALAIFGARLFGCAVASGVLHWKARDLLKDLR